MAEKKKREPPMTLNLSFEEALARFAQTDPKDIEGLKEQVERDEEEVDQYVKDREDSIRSGARRAKKRFRL